MNISTYESRIKALEDQLNPPAPGGDTGLLSVVVTPDITLSDGTSLNAKLAALMPMAAGGMERIAEETLTPLSAESVYTVTATPGSEWYTIVNNTVGEKGAAVEVTRQATESASGYFLGSSIYCVEDPNDESAPSCRLQLRIGAHEE